MDSLLGLRELIAERQVVAIVGAGVSMGVTGGARVASWVGLLEDGITRCESVANPSPPIGWGDRQREALKTNDLVELVGVATQVERRLGAPEAGEYKQWLRESVGALQVRDSAVLVALRDLGIILATTNYDNLVEDVTGYPAVTWRDTTDVERAVRGKERGVLHLHGHWKRPESVVLGGHAYTEVVRDAHAQAVQKALALMNSFLFVGYGQGLADPNFGGLLHWMRQALAGSEYRHFRLCLRSEQAEIQALHPREERVFALSYGAKHEDLAPFLQSLVVKKALAPNVDTGAIFRRDSHSDPLASTQLQRPDVGPAPELPTEELRERFIGRLGLLEDLGDALRGLENRQRNLPPQGAAKVQAIWYHGFGGMGKSWFLRRAILEAQQRVPSVKVALIDWDQPSWRSPLSQPPEVPKELLQPIAHCPPACAAIRIRIPRSLLEGRAPNRRGRSGGKSSARSVSGAPARVPGGQGH
jgi:hypothetical protein